VDCGGALPSLLSSRVTPVAAEAGASGPSAPRETWFADDEFISSTAGDAARSDMRCDGRRGEKSDDWRMTKRWSWIWYASLRGTRATKLGARNSGECEYVCKGGELG
jgi:hypothetical protein